MAVDKKIRMSFTGQELREIYVSLGARCGMVRDNAAINDLRQSEYVSQVAVITGMQDRIYSALNDSNSPETKEQQ